MRRQKEIAYTKTEMAEATVQRLESQLKFMEAQYEEVKAKLSQNQQDSHYSVMTSAKQAELLRKVETLSALTDSNR
jgi:nucleoprotein TPR